MTAFWTYARASLILPALLTLTAPLAAQVPEDDFPELPELPPIIEPETRTPVLPEEPEDPEIGDDGETDAQTEDPREDIVIHSDKDRKAQLDKLFDRLAEIEDETEANLLAEEIWAIWLQSGSASVDYILLRGTTAQASGNNALARRMFEQVMRLEPDYAEGWVRSARLALEEQDMPTALHDVTQSLILEPRHFYGLWTLGNIFERLEQYDEAFEAYSEANKLYPALATVKERVDYLRSGVEGEAL